MHSTDEYIAVAKDSDAPIGTRVRAAGDAISDKVDEKQNKVRRVSRAVAVSWNHTDRDCRPLRT